MIAVRIAAALLLSLVTSAQAEPPRSKDECLARLGALTALVQKARLGDELQARVDEELVRARSNCAAALYREAERAMELAERLAKGEPDPE